MTTVFSASSAGAGATRTSIADDVATAANRGLADQETDAGPRQGRRAGGRGPAGSSTLWTRWPGRRPGAPPPARRAAGGRARATSAPAAGPGVLPSDNPSAQDRLKTPERGFRTVPTRVVMAAQARSVPTAMRGSSPRRLRVGSGRTPAPTPERPTRRPTARPTAARRAGIGRPPLGHGTARRHGRRRRGLGEPLRNDWRAGGREGRCGGGQIRRVSAPGRSGAGWPDRPSSGRSPSTAGAPAAGSGRSGSVGSRGRWRTRVWMPSRLPRRRP